MFITLDENGADGLIPMRSLPDDYYIHDEKQHALVGRKHKRIYRLGATVKIRLAEADGLTGSSVFELVGKDSADIPGVTFKAVKSYGGGGGKRKDKKSGKKHKKKGKKTPGKAPFKGKKKPKKKK